MGNFPSKLTSVSGRLGKFPGQTVAVQWRAEWVTLTAAITIHDHANNLKKKKKIWGGGVESWGFCGGGRLFLWPHPKWETALSVENFHLVIFYDTALLPGVLEKQSCDPKRDFHGIVRSLTWR